jgi:hypothetical protein
MSKQTRTLRCKGRGELAGRDTRSENDHPTSYKGCEIIDQELETNREVEDDYKI